MFKESELDMYFDYVLYFYKSFILSCFIALQSRIIYCIYYILSNRLTVKAE